MVQEDSLLRREWYGRYSKKFENILRFYLTYGVRDDTVQLVFVSLNDELFKRCQRKK
jgi:hypothetical protein